MLDPFEELHIPSGQGKAVTEVHLSGRGISSIHPNFQRLVNLETLWLANNKLAKIENLIPDEYQNNEKDIVDRVHGLGCLRLRRLYLSNNRLNTLVGDLKHLKFLEVLLLANNRLTNLEVISTLLRPLQFLKQLDLFGNPLAEEQNYREYIIHHHPSVLILDRRSVTTEERTLAARLVGSHTMPGRGGSSVAFGKIVPEDVRTYRPSKAPSMSESVQRVERHVKRIHAREAAAVQKAHNEELAMVREREEARTRLTIPMADNDAIIESGLHKRREAERAQQQLADRQRLHHLLFRPADLLTIQQSFDESHLLDAADILAILKTVGYDTSNLHSSLQRLLSQRQVNVPNVLDALLEVPPFVQRQLDNLYSAAQAALLADREREAKQMHVDINFLECHLTRLTDVV